MLALVGARNVLWSLSDSYPYVRFVVGAVDEKMNARLVPGILDFRQNFIIPNS